MKKEYIYLTSTIIIAVTILIFSLSKIFVIEQFSLSNSGTFAHLVSYFFLSTMFGFYLREKKQNNYLAIAILSAISYGILIELMQSVVPYRSLETMDIVINSIGAGFSAFIFFAKNTFGF